MFAQAQENAKYLAFDFMGAFTVCTNNERNFGAAVLTDTQFFAELSDNFDANLFILPCSVHEVLAVPDEGMCTPEHLKEIVSEINRSGEIKDNEFLSDSVYYYDRNENRVTIVQ